MPIQKLAYAFSLFSEPDKQPGARGLAMTSILNSIAKHPEMIAGSERCCSAVVKETQGQVIVKYGAESVYAGVIPHLKLGFALKIDDGTARGSEVALGALLNKVNAITTAQNEQLQPFFNPDIINSLNNKTGEIRAANVWQE
jgi:L-asparaginase II